MSTLTLTSKGQVTLRKELLAHLGSAPGDRLSVEKLPDGRLEVRAAPVAGPISAVFGLLKNSDHRTLSIGEIGEIAAAGWAGER